jgi:hypothetical protein
MYGGEEYGNRSAAVNDFARLHDRQRDIAGQRPAAVTRAAKRLEVRSDGFR